MYSIHFPNAIRQVESFFTGCLSDSNHDIKSLELLLKKGARTHCITPQGESPLQKEENMPIVIQL